MNTLLSGAIKRLESNNGKPLTKEMITALLENCEVVHEERSLWRRTRHSVLRINCEDYLIMRVKNEV